MSARYRPHHRAWRTRQGLQGCGHDHPRVAAGGQGITSCRRHESLANAIGSAFPPLPVYVRLQVRLGHRVRQGRVPGQRVAPWQAVACSQDELVSVGRQSLYLRSCSRSGVPGRDERGEGWQRSDVSGAGNQVPPHRASDADRSFIAAIDDPAVTPASLKRDSSGHLPEVDRNDRRSPFPRLGHGTASPPHGRGALVARWPGWCRRQTSACPGRHP